MGTFQELLARIARALENAKIPYMVIGGQAVLVHGRPRFTGDIDITLGVDIDSLQRVQDITRNLGLRPLLKDIEQLAKQTNVFPVVEDATKIKVDFIFSFSEYELEAIKRAKPIEVERTKVCYASPEDLIIHKLVAGRPVDISDAKSILNAQPNMDKDYTRKWLKAYSESVGRDLQAEFLGLEKQIRRNKDSQ